MNQPTQRKHTAHLAQLRASGQHAAAAVYASANHPALAKEHREHDAERDAADAASRQQYLGSLRERAPHTHHVESLRARGESFRAEAYRRTHTLALNDEQRAIERK